MEANTASLASLGAFLFLWLTHSATNASPESATPIFIPYMPALLPSPRSTPPRPPAARRKTLAGVTGFQLPRQSPRLRAKKRKMPIAKLAEQLLCRRMNIVAEGEQVTEAAIAKFAQMLASCQILPLRPSARSSSWTVTFLQQWRRPWCSMVEKEVQSWTRLPPRASDPTAYSLL
ncbi:uncharacterized protein [Aegilops tauschii subsp. strangulata]|uniref:uncharacterized protein n=1 Tax=Aegilops tauschii subsp. strangulata TaxID=200361 RepID=UPI000989C7F4|nr:uncharacterized protein LOC109734255 [Aegilops tauschii subsp. strangulata]